MVLWRAVFDVEHVLNGPPPPGNFKASRAWGFGEAANNIEAELSLDSDDDDDMSDRSVTDGTQCRMITQSGYGI